MTEAQELSSRYDPHQLERIHYANWTESGYFTADPGRPGDPFTIVIPPPNVTGYLHIGHGLNNTLQDVLIRWRRMAGDNALWVPGTDHAGIATQMVVARDLKERENLEPRDLGREKFLERVWAWKEERGSRILEQLRRLGASCDWTRERFTMDEGLSRAVLTVFKRLFEEGLIYRGDYLVNWSPKLRTAISDDEVEHREVNGHLWHLCYPLADGSGHVQVATTRPETMLGDTAVAVNPEDERYAGMIGQSVMLPLMNRPIPIVGDSFVDMSFGTGAVKVTPAHDPNDYEMGKRHDLEFINILNPDGTLNGNVGVYEGLPTHEARSRVVEDIDALGLLVRVEDHIHSVGHCHRSGCVVEPYLSKQWFVRMKPLTEPAMRAVQDGRIEFVPRHHEKVYFHWLENVRDWCISRQLWWGHRIPVFTCGDCGHVFCEIEEAPAACTKCGSANLEQDPDVLDTWFSSALWPFSTLGWPDDTADLRRYYPTSVLVTGPDIIFFWVARMIMMGLKFMGDVPFSKVVINAIVFGEDKEKMSKTRGNVVDPLEVVDEVGADSLRLMLTSYPTQTRIIHWSTQRLEGWRNFGNKLWNAARFVLMNTQDLAGEDLARGLDGDALQLEDRWILGALDRTMRQSETNLRACTFDGYVETLYQFIWRSYCDWYLELVKDRLYAQPEQADADPRFSTRSRTSAQVVLITVLEHIQRLLHPVAPYITEEIWQKLKTRWCGMEGAASPTAAALNRESIVIAPWPTGADGSAAPYAGLIDAEADAAMELTMEAIGRIRTIRGEMNMPPGARAHVDIVSDNVARLETLRAGEHYMRSLIALDALSFGPQPTREDFASTAVIEDVTIHVYLPAELLEAERKRLDKELARLEKGVAGAEKKLGNEKFLSGAPEAVVQSERERLTKLRTELAELREKRSGLR